MYEHPLSNPEFQRNLALEFTGNRVLAVGGLLCIVLVWSWISAGSFLDPSVYMVALLMFGLLTGVLGAKAAADSLFTEVTDHTWDIQRLSALGPWQMTLGKLFGATFITWMGGAFCLVIAFLAGSESLAHKLNIIFAGVGAALALQAAALMLATFAIMRGSEPRGFLIPLIALLALPGLASWIYGPVADDAFLDWFGYRTDSMLFIQVSVWCFVAWALFGANRAMARALAVRTTPWAWPAFAVFLCIYLAGLHTATWKPAVELIGEVLKSAPALLVVLSYIAAIVEPKDLLLIRRLQHHLALGEHARAIALLPAWLWTLTLALICVPLLLGNGIVLVLACLRDIGLLYFFALRPDARRPETAMLLSMLVLWWLIPSIVSTLGFPQIKGAMLPGADVSVVPALVLLVLELTVVFALLSSRWRARLKIRTPE